MRLITAILALIPLTIAQYSTPPSSNAPLQRSFISAAQATTVIRSAVANATASHIADNIAVVDPSGLLVAFLRMDNSFLGSIDLSMKKAKTAILFNGLYGSAELYAAAQPGQELYGIEETNGGLTLFGGGFPIFMNGQLIGGVGVSGGTVAQDEMVAMAGVLGLSGAGVTPRS
jgi:uncharacterized protein GlcG (DUF336 family)